MFDGFLMSMNNKLKKVLTNQDDHTGRFDLVDADIAALKADILASLGSSGGGGIKKIQRGTATAAGTITIEEVVMEKTMVLSVSKGSAGTVATSGTISMNSASVSGTIGVGGAKSGISASSNYNSTFSGTVAAHTGTLSGGTTNLTVAEYSAVLTNSTTLTCDGACEWQVIEFN